MKSSRRHISVSRPDPYSGDQAHQDILELEPRTDLIRLTEMVKIGTLNGEWVGNFKIVRKGMIMAEPDDITRGYY